MNVNQNCSDDLAARRAALGWTRYKLAKLAGVRPATIKAIEGGQRPQPSTWRAIDHALREGEETA